jgi:peptidoglycan/xylan/chitin deacetylase (PgdA/CDA1 family)
VIVGSADVPVLMYHEISASPFGSRRLAVSPRNFASQLAYLADQGFSSVTAGDLATAVACRSPLPDRSVVLTFDDGFADFHQTALPLLEKYRFTATLFMTTGWIRDAQFPAGTAPGPMLSWRQLSEAAAAGIEVAAHSHRHPQLDQLAPHAVRRELATSKKILEDQLGAAVPGLAYPFGYSNPRVRDAARDLGYGYGYVVANRLARTNPDQYALPRLTVSRSTSLPRFGQIAECRNLSAAFFKDRAMSRGWAGFRRASGAVRWVGQRDDQEPLAYDIG